MKNYSIFIFLFVLGLWNCAENNADCADCGGGLLEGYLYKEVTLEDVGKLAEIAVAWLDRKCGLHAAGSQNIWIF